MIVRFAFTFVHKCITDIKIVPWNSISRCIFHVLHLMTLTYSIQFVVNGMIVFQMTMCFYCYPAIPLCCFFITVQDIDFLLIIIMIPTCSLTVPLHWLHENESRHILYFTEYTFPMKIDQNSSQSNRVHNENTDGDSVRTHAMHDLSFFYFSIQNIKTMLVHLKSHNRPKTKFFFNTAPTEKKSFANNIHITLCIFLGVERKWVKNVYSLSSFPNINIIIWFTLA